MNPIAAYLNAPRGAADDSCGTAGDKCGMTCDVTDGAAYNDAEDVHKEPCKPCADSCAKPLVRVAGVLRTDALKTILHWRPDAVYTFASHMLLTEYRNSNSDVGITFISLADPTNKNPWDDADIKTFCRAASDARKLVLAGKKVAFLCKAGRNRSPTLARMATLGMKLDGVPMPVDEALRELAACDPDELSAAMQLAPLGVRKQRKRSRSEE